MGTSGRHTMGDYDAGRYAAKASAGAVAGTASSSASGTGDEIIRLEDVSTSDYYLQHHAVPSVGIAVYISNELKGKRMVVCENDSSLVLGNIPTKYQMRFRDVLNGTSYRGEVAASKETPIPAIGVRIHA